MNTLAKPAMRPARPEFSSGPCAKRPGWSPQNLQNAVLGRSHRSKPGKARLKDAIDRTRQLLEVPDDYLVGIVPGSDTGAVEMAMWSMLGPRPIQLLAFESFGKDWVTDVVKQLKLPAEVLEAPYGELPDLTKVRPDADLVFTWNGTTSGVRVPNADFISADREGITICDATSAAFAQDLDWAKLDVVTFSWQKALGGEGAHGVLVLSPRAVARLESHTPAWPMPKLVRMTKNGKVTLDLFEGATINTPSMLCVEDVIDALTWAQGTPPPPLGHNTPRTLRLVRQPTLTPPVPTATSPGRQATGPRRHAPPMSQRYSPGECHPFTLTRAQSTLPSPQAQLPPSPAGNTTEYRALQQ
jgi:phosphoserine aminotransferase